MQTKNPDIFAELADALETAPPDALRLRLTRALLRLLARGAPVRVDELAVTIESAPSEVRASLAAMPDTEYDVEGRIIGYGITLRPTPHHFEVNQQQLYTWCAVDTLMFPGILDRAARVESPCHATGAPIRMGVDVSGVHELDPSTAVVSLVLPNDVRSVRTAFCNEVHFFASPQAAEAWLAEHPGAHVIPVADAYDLGEVLFDRLLGGSGPKGKGCC
ncbi:MAG TPA: organomercurial lyase MerB [Myxococcales bacterium]|nr:organomercurial lyase MerB [Myxococcales bacterium]